MRNKKSLLGKKCENVHTPNALSHKIAPVLNIFCLPKIFVDLSSFFYFDWSSWSIVRMEPQ